MLKHFTPFSLTNVLIFDARAQETAAILRKWQETFHYQLSRLYQICLLVVVLLPPILYYITPQVVLR